MKHRPQRHRYKGHIFTHSWAHLPHIVLVEVFKNLTDSDRISCAQACHRWKDAYESPQLWRKREFEFGGSRFRPLGRAAIDYAKKFGRHLREMKILCRQLTSHTCVSMIGNLEEFLGQLVTSGPPELTILEITGLELDFWRYSELRDQVADCLIKFFRTQFSLKTFNMSNAQFPHNIGISVMEEIATNNAKSMDTLMLEGFFQSRPHVFQTNIFNNSMEKFQRLQSVDINYCCLCDQLISSWADTLKGHLKKLRIFCWDNEPYNHVITSSTWTKMVTSCPDLGVAMMVYGIGHSREIMPILSSTMPLKGLRLFTGYDNGHELGLSELLTHLGTRFPKTLQFLELEFDNYHDRIDDQFILLLTRCRHLNALKIKARIDIEVARFVCRMVKEGRTELKDVVLTSCDMSPLQMTQLRDLRDEIEEIDDENGVTMLLRDDLYP